jgi:hypothetical protein
MEILLRPTAWRIFHGGLQTHFRIVVVNGESSQVTSSCKSIPHMCFTPTSTTWILHQAQPPSRSPIQRLTIQKMYTEFKMCEVELSGKQYVTLLRKNQFSPVSFTLPFLFSMIYCWQGIDAGGYVVLTQRPCGDYRPRPNEFILT